MHKPQVQPSMSQRNAMDILRSEQGNTRTDNPVGISLTPKLISERVYLKLKSQCEDILDALEIFVKEYVEHDFGREIFPELEEVVSLIKLKPSIHRWVWLARFDIVESTEGDYKIVETNANCPGGLTRLSLIEKAFLSTPYHLQLPISKSVRVPMSEGDYFVSKLIDLACSSTRKSLDELGIGVINSRNGNLLTDLDSIVLSLRQHGIKAKQMAVQDVAPVLHQIGWNETPMHFAYHKIGTYADEKGMIRHRMFYQDHKEIYSYWEAILSGNIPFANTFGSMLLADSKKILYALTMPALQTIFSSRQKEAISALIPRTFPLLSVAHDHPDRNYVQKNKDHYVVKKTNDSRGRSVLIGSQMDTVEWNTQISAASENVWVAQELVRQKPEMTLSGDKTPQLVPMYHNFGAFLIDGHMSGMFCRASPDPLVSVAHKAVFRPVLVTED